MMGLVAYLLSNYHHHTFSFVLEIGYVPSDFLKPLFWLFGWLCDVLSFYFFSSIETDAGGTDLIDVVLTNARVIDAGISH